MAICNCVKGSPRSGPVNVCNWVASCQSATDPIADVHQFVHTWRMRTAWLLIPISGILVGCSASQPIDCAVATEPKRAMACLEQRQGVTSRNAIAACFPFSPSQRMRGIWLVSFENSTFFEGKVVFDRTMLTRASTWLDPAALPKGVRSSAPEVSVKAYKVEIIGRRSICPAYYGHLGVFPHEVIVDSFVRAGPASLE